MALVAVALALAALWPVTGSGFVNWDDPDALAHNAALEGPGMVAWAFRTTHMSHYQPLSWLAWAAVRKLGGTGPAAHHAASLLVHALNAALVYLLARRAGALLRLTPARARATALVAALLFSVHPLRVEPVAWASGFPYLLALAPLLVSVVAYLNHVAAGGSWPWLGVALAAYALSLLARAVAPGLFAILLAIDLVAGRLRAPATRARVMAEKVPFILLAMAATLAEGSARRFASLERVGPGARLSDAALAPFIYVMRTLVPIGLSPLDPLPLDARTSWPALAIGLAFAAMVTAAAWKARHAAPELLLLWVAYLVLLGPALGLAPSGLQVTADRYTYFAGVALAMAAASGLARAWPRLVLRRALLAALVLAVPALAVGSYRQALWWRDSVTLWTRAVQLDPRNDVALYNLASALAERGDDEAAALRYGELLQLVPDHGPARRNLDRLEVARLERQAGERAAAGRLEEAVSLYTAALVRDPVRAHSQASRGVALVQLGRFHDGLPDLRAAVQRSPGEPGLASALAFALVQSGLEAEARRILEEALRARPGEPGLTHNLARLLATSQDPGVRDGRRALALAREAVQATGERDPRALDTLAVAYAEAGRPAEARQAAARAASLARAAGEADLARDIERRARSYARGARRDGVAPRP